MFNKKSARLFFAALIAAVIVFSVLPENIFAAANPWDAYSSFIPYETPVVKRELRGTWISTVANLDWPSSDTRKIANDDERIQKSKDELIEILDRVVEMNMNAVFFQVGPEADAFYKSDIVPWSRYLTGTFGKDPGFDPLAFAIEEAHKRNLEFHAWFNPYRVTVDKKDATKASLDIEKSVYKEHPEWIKTSNGRYVVDPGIPEARKWVINRVMEVVNNYDVDGVHFDDYFYYEETVGELNDQSTYEKYNNGQFSNLGDFRRNNTYLLVSELSKEIRSTKSWVKFGISPAGIWGNKKDGLSVGSNTQASFTNYGSCFADTRKWVQDELIDYIAPQIYFSFGYSRAAYGELATWWSDVCRGKNVHLYIGMALYRINDTSDKYFTNSNGVPEFTRQLKFNTVKPEIMGDIMFRVQNLKDAKKQPVVNTMKNSLRSAKALIPIMDWKGGKAPENPINGKIEVVSNALKLTWNDNDSSTAYYAVYRFNIGQNADIASDMSAKKLVGTIRKTENGVQEFIDTSSFDSEKVFYVVTALDRLHNESSGLTITTKQSNYFSDVGIKYSWAINAIDLLYEKGVVNGMGNGIFSPGKYTKRGDFTIMVVKALNFEADFTENFSDVKNDSYYYNSIGIAKKLGIVKGTGESFDPEENISRQDMMVIMLKALEVKGENYEKAGDDCLDIYSDKNQISDYAKEAIAFLTKMGIVNGSGGKVNPKQLATRAELSVILQKVLDTAF